MRPSSQGLFGTGRRGVAIEEETSDYLQHSSWRGDSARAQQCEAPLGISPCELRIARDPVFGFGRAALRTNCLRPCRLWQVMVQFPLRMSAEDRMLQIVTQAAHRLTS